MKYILSCEGETERWYFEWLSKQINGNSKVKDKVSFLYKKLSPSSFVKSNNGFYMREMIAGSIYCRIQDIEDYGEYHIKQFEDLLKSNKEAKKYFPRFDFHIAYSNFTFEVWILSHKTQVRSIIDRKDYYKEINRAFKTEFADNDDYKHQNNFKSLLETLTLEDVIQKALPECKRFNSETENNNPDKKRELYGFEYVLENPHTTLDNFVELILINSGII